MGRFQAKTYDAGRHHLRGPAVAPPGYGRRGRGLRNYALTVGNHDVWWDQTDASSPIEFRCNYKLQNPTDGVPPSDISLLCLQYLTAKGTDTGRPTASTAFSTALNSPDSDY